MVIVLFSSNYRFFGLFLRTILVDLIKHALSGSNLYQQWNPGNRQKNIRGEEQYARDIAGMEQSRQYSSNLKNFIEQIRKDSNSEFSVNNALLIPADDLQMLYNDYQIQHLKMTLKLYRL